MSSLTEAVALNKAAAANAEAIGRVVDAEHRTNGAPVPEDLFHRYEAAHAVVWESAKALAQLAEVGQEVQDGDGALIVAERFIGHSYKLNVHLTSDGKAIGEDWHTGDKSDTAVRYERWAFDEGVLLGRAHGFIDPVSRQIVQVG